MQTILYVAGKVSGRHIVQGGAFPDKKKETGKRKKP